MLFSRFAQMAAKVTNGSVFTPAVRGVERLTVHQSVQALPSVGPRRAVTIRAGTMWYCCEPQTGTRTCQHVTRQQKNKEQLMVPKPLDGNGSAEIVYVHPVMHACNDNRHTT